MIANVAKRGTSFKGAFSYYLHDKKQEGETSRTTDKRVAWSSTRGIMGDDPDLAMRVMISTAQQKDQLKERAGIRKGGRQSKGDVYVYSLSWHPDEAGKIDKAEMMKAVDQSLKAIGAQEHQAVIVAHNDEPHPHVHVILNAVNPKNGKNLATSNDFRKLEAWAFQYRKERGEENTYCKKRTEKFNAIASKKQGNKVDFVRGDRAVPRSTEAEIKDVRRSANDDDVKAVLKEQRHHDRTLSDYGRQMHVRHGHEWEALSDNYKLKKRHIRDQHRSEKAQATESIKTRMKPLFSELHRRQWREREDFRKKETRVTGKLQNAMSAVRHAMLNGRDGDEPVLAMAFSFIGNGGSRNAYMERKHVQELRELRAVQSRQIKAVVAQVGDTRREKVRNAWTSFSIDRNALIGKQKLEKDELKSKWRVRSDRKRRVIALLKEKGVIRSQDRVKIKPEEEISARNYFESKKRERAKRKRSPRARKRDGDDD